jgi:hypothetical protein
MAFCIGIANRDQPSASPNLVVSVHLYPRKRGGKERFRHLGKIVTHIDMASSNCINLHDKNVSAIRSALQPSDHCHGPGAFQWATKLLPSPIACRHVFVVPFGHSMASR